jgi:hypothetical protein
MGTKAIERIRKRIYRQELKFGRLPSGRKIEDKARRVAELSEKKRRLG